MVTMDLNYQKPTFAVRVNPIETGVKSVYDALAIISYVKKINPKAKLIPYSRTYNIAVLQYNLNIKNTMSRPPVPDWFCGRVDPDTGLLVDDSVLKDAGGAAFTGGLIGGLSGFSGSLQYEWDDCVVKNGATPGSPAYVMCDDDLVYDSDMGTNKFWSDFVVEYDEDAVASMYSMAGGGGGEGSGGCDSSATGVSFGDAEWCYGGYTPDSLSKGSFTYKVTGGTTNSITSSNGGDWGVASGRNAAFIVCLFVKQSKGWRGGKFDWISQNRTSRDLKNVYSGYGGWCSEGVAKGKPFKACVVDEKGKKWSGMSGGTFN